MVFKYFVNAITWQFSFSLILSIWFAFYGQQVKYTRGSQLYFNLRPILGTATPLFELVLLCFFSKPFGCGMLLCLPFLVFELVLLCFFLSFLVVGCFALLGLLALCFHFILSCWWPSLTEGGGNLFLGWESISVCVCVRGCLWAKWWFHG